MEQIYPKKASHSLNQSHYEVWALITLKEVGLGNKKIHTMPPCHMKKHYGTQLYQNGVIQRNNNTVLIFVLPTHLHP
jgi:hypothetical protein